MNWAQFKDPVFNMYLAGGMVSSEFVTQDVAGSNPFGVITIFFVTEFSENI